MIPSWRRAAFKASRVRGFESVKTRCVFFLEYTSLPLQEITPSSPTWKSQPVVIFAGSNPSISFVSNVRVLCGPMRSSVLVPSLWPPRSCSATKSVRLFECKNWARSWKNSWGTVTALGGGAPSWNSYGTKVSLDCKRKTWPWIALLASSYRNRLGPTWFKVARNLDLLSVQHKLIRDLKMSMQEMDAKGVVRLVANKKLA